MKCFYMHKLIWIAMFTLPCVLAKRKRRGPILPVSMLVFVCVISFHYGKI